ncbi:MAG: methyltransferase domain-containing protein [Methyloceanibacter sp.]
MRSCRVCCASIAPFMTFGRMPMANGFLWPDEFAEEYFYELQPSFCAACGTFQIIDQPDPRRLFHDKYAFFTRTSRRMVAHFQAYAGWISERFLAGTDPFVVEIGSNDGAMLENFAKRDCRHLGIEPSANAADEALRFGIACKVAFFGEETARTIHKQHGPADAIIAANVICHIPDLNDVGRGVASLLTEDGVFVFEEPYLAAMVEKGSYDQIYDAHVFIFSARAVQNIFAPHGLELTELLPQWTHGGSMRYVLARKGARAVHPSVERILRDESRQGLDIPETFERFRERCERSREALIDLVRTVRRKGKRVVGYAATAKSTTVLNYCGLGPEDVEFVSDTTPIKQHKFTPGTHIPVRPYEVFAEDYPDYALLFAWNHETEILQKEGEFAASGGKWIKFVPQVIVE